MKKGESKYYYNVLFWDEVNHEMYSLGFTSNKWQWLRNSGWNRKRYIKDLIFQKRYCSYTSRLTVLMEG